MTDPIYRIVYVSKANPDLTTGDIENILNTSQSNNDERFITGYLAHNEHGFMQLLEGPEGEVRETYSRICQDQRHIGVVQVQGEMAVARAFPQWSMNYYRVDDAQKGGVMVLRRNDPVDALMTANAPRDLIHLFSKFIKVQ